MNMDNKTNGQNEPTRVAELTAEAIKKSGLSVADEIRALAQKAKDEGEALAAYAEEVAGAIIQASSEASARISAYIDSCAAAKSSVQRHKDTLADLPASTPATLQALAMQQAQGVSPLSWQNQAPESLAAVEKAIATLKGEKRG
jgi:hypothetical protein